MTDILKSLQAFSWRGIEFPVTAMRLSISQSLAEHEYWGFDGARVEATGRKPLIFTATIPFLNGIAPGNAERWGQLYPTTFRKFLSAMADKSTGALIHPEMGDLSAKPHSATADWKGDSARSGAMVEATWTETLVESYDLTALDNPSTVADVRVAATSLDVLETELRSELEGYTLPKFERTFTDTFDELAAVGDQVWAFKLRATGKIDNLIYKANSVREAALRALDPLAWPAVQSATRLLDAAEDLRKSVNAAGGRDIVFYSVPSATTVAALVPVTQTPVGELIELNPTLAIDPIVKRDTVIRYYASHRRFAA